MSVITATQARERGVTVLQLAACHRWQVSQARTTKDRRAAQRFQDQANKLEATIRELVA